MATTIPQSNPELAICTQKNTQNGLTTPHSGKTLVALRTVRGMSQIAMAQALGIPMEHLTRLETDLRPLSAAIQLKIERAFGHSIHHSLPPH